MTMTHKYSSMDILKIIEFENELHPESEYVDYYKLLFQAFFGQGHFVHNQEKASKYLIEEVANYCPIYLPHIQDIGNGNGIYRFSLRLIFDNLLKIDDFLAIYMKYDDAVIDWKEWLTTWDTISQTLLFKFPKLTNEKQIDYVHEVIINENLCSHSERFRLTYKPHYRVMTVHDYDFSLYPVLKDLI